MYARIHLPVVAILLLAGCGDDGVLPGGVDASTPDTSAPAGPSGTLQLHVFDVDISTPDGTTTPPLANASVAFYPPGGGAMMETTSGSDGLVTFSGVDWSQGTGTVVAYMADRSGLILTDVDPENVAKLPKNTNYDGLTIGLATYASKINQAMITGNIVNKMDPTHNVTLGTTISSSYFQNSTTSYSLSVPPGKAFSLLGTEWKAETAPAIQSFFKWIKVDVPAGTTTLDVDFSTATALTSQKIKRTFVVPGGASGALGGTSGYLQVTVPQSSAPLGYATSQQAATDGASVAVEAEVIPNFPSAVITYNTLQKSDASVSYLIEDGAPADGTTVDGFLAPPAFTFNSVHLGDPLTITGLVDSEDATAYYLNGNDTLLILGSAAAAPAGQATRTLTPPATATLPAAFRTQLGTKAIVSYFICRLANDQLPISKLGRHFAYSRQFTTTP